MKRKLLCLILCSMAFSAFGATPEEALAQSFDTWIHEGKRDEINKAYDVPRFFERLHGRIAGDDAEWKDFSNACIGKPFLGEWYCQKAQRAHMKFLRVFPGEKESRALFTIYDQSGLNHLELIIVPGETGPRIIDHRMLSTGEYFSEEKRFAYLSYLQNKNPETFAKLARDNDTEIGDALKLSDYADAMRSALGADDNKKVLKIYDSLPERFKGKRALLMLRLNAATWLTAEDWTKAAQDFENFFPDDPQNQIFKIDVFIREKKVDEVFKAIDAYDKAVGGEPLLNLFRANALDEAGRPAEAIPYAQKAVEAAPRMTSVLGALFHSQISARDYEGAVKTLKTMDEISRIDLYKFRQDPTLADFLKTPQFMRFNAERK